MIQLQNSYVRHVCRSNGCCNVIDIVARTNCDGTLAMPAAGATDYVITYSVNILIK